jgi:hypothetical protein
MRVERVLSLARRGARVGGGDQAIGSVQMGLWLALALSRSVMFSGVWRAEPHRGCVTLSVGHVGAARCLFLSRSPATICPVGAEQTRDVEGPFEAQSHAPMLVTSLWRESARVEGVGVGSVGLSLVLVEAEQRASFRDRSFTHATKFGCCERSRGRLLVGNAAPCWTSSSPSASPSSPPPFESARLRWTRLTVRRVGPREEGVVVCFGPQPRMTLKWIGRERLRLH